MLLFYLVFIVITSGVACRWICINRSQLREFHGAVNQIELHEMFPLQCYAVYYAWLSNITLLLFYNSTLLPERCMPSSIFHNEFSLSFVVFSIPPEMEDFFVEFTLNGAHYYFCDKWSFFNQKMAKINFYLLKTTGNPLWESIRFANV